MKQKLSFSILLIIIAFTFCPHQAAAVQYSSTNSSTWCGSTLQLAINSADYTNLFGTELSYIATDNDCTGARFSLVSNSEWESGKSAYNSVIGGGNYLPAGVTNAWTRTPNGANNVFVITSTGTSTTSVAANSNAGYEALPTLYLAEGVCVASDAVAGNSANPYTLTTVGCNTAPTMTITNSTTQIIAKTASGISISGTVTDPDSSQTLTISATIGGTTKNTTATSGTAGTAWAITWTFAELAAGTHSNIAFSVSDGTATGTASYTGNIIVDKTAPVCTAAVWNPATSPWKASGGQLFNLASGVTDAGGSNLNVSTGSCTTGAANGNTCNVTVSDNAGNTAACTSPANRVDNASPLPACTLTEGTNPQYQYVNGTTVYYNPNQTGGFTAAASVTAPASGITKFTFPQMTATGWTPAAATDDTTSPYSQIYAWTTAATASPGSKNIVATYGNGLTNQCTIVVTADAAAPTGSTFSYATQYVNSLATPAINVNISSPSDSGSGVNATSRALFRRSAPLSGGVCGTYGSWTSTTWTGSEPNIIATEAIADSTCYQYQATVADNVGNVLTITSTNEIKVNTNEPVLNITGVTDTASSLYFDSGSKTLYYKTPSSNTNFTVNVSATDPVSGIKNVTFPGISTTGFTPATPETQNAAAGNAYSRTYTISSAANTSPGTLTVRAENNSSIAETQNFTITADNAGPSGSSVTCPGAYSSDASFNILGTPGTDAGAGIDTAQSFIQVASAPLSGDACGTFAAFGNTGSAMSTNLSQNPMSEGCYQYRYHSVDLVGNVTDSDTCTIKVDLTDPVCGTWAPADPLPWKNTAETQEFTLSGSTDDGTGMAQPSYVCTAAATNNATCSVTAEDKAGNQVVCTSPANRVDTGMPNLVVSTPDPGWLTTPQEITISATDTNSGLNRLAYSWNTNTLGADCTGGTQIHSGDSITDTQIAGERTLYVCASNVAGNVATYTDDYRYSPMPSIPHLANQAPSSSLYWNVISLSPEMPALRVQGYFEPEDLSRTYNLELQIPVAGTSYPITVTTSTTDNTTFEFIVPMSDFGADQENANFIGPQLVTVTDAVSNQVTTVNYNVSYYFPIYQATTKANTGYFIMISDSRPNALTPTPPQSPAIECSPACPFMEHCNGAGQCVPNVCDPACPSSSFCLSDGTCTPQGI